MIKPTVGRVLHFFNARRMVPQAAIIVHVHNDHDINVIAFEPNGNLEPRLNVPLIHDTEDAPDGHYAAWMPYQHGQAAKTDALEEDLLHRLEQVEAVVFADVQYETCGEEGDAPAEDEPELEAIVQSLEAE